MMLQKTVNNSIPVEFSIHCNESKLALLSVSELHGMIKEFQSRRYAISENSSSFGPVHPNQSLIIANKKIVGNDPESSILLSDLEIRVPLVFLHCEIYHTLNLNRSVIPQLSIKGGYCRRIIARECDIRGTVHLKGVHFDEGIDFSHAKIGGAFYVEQSEIGLDAINKSHYVVYNPQKCSLNYSDRNKHSEAICENCDDFCKNTLRLTKAKITGALCIHHTKVHNGIDLFGAHIDSQVKFFYSTFKIGCHKKNNRNGFDGRMQNMKIGEDLTIENCFFEYGLDISSSSIEKELDLDGLKSSLGSITTVQNNLV